MNFFQKHDSDIIKFHLDETGFQIEDHEDLNQLLSDERVFDSAFEYVESEYKLLKYAKHNLNLVQPVQRVIGINSKGTQDTFQYVPILDVLKLVLLKENIWGSVNRSCETS